MLIKVELLITFLIMATVNVQSFLSQRASIPRDARVRRFLSSRYLPPEMDPDYQDVVISPALFTAVIENETAADALYPFPKEGDVVSYPGKWLGEYNLGKIRFISYNDNRQIWVADIVPLKEGKSDNVYCIDRTARTFFSNVSDLRPVRCYYLRSENGYKIAVRQNSTEPLLRAPSYRSMSADYKMVTQQKQVNLTILEEDLASYSDLKKRLVKSTLLYGAVGTVGTALVFGPDVSFSYFSGALAGGLYLYLLGLKTDLIGSGFTVQNANISSVIPTTDVVDGSSPNRLKNLVTNGRLLVPVLLMAVLSAKNVVTNSVDMSLYKTLSKEQFLGAMAGFLTYRLSVFVTEVLSEVRTEDVLGVMPGSLAEGYRQVQKTKADGDRSEGLKEKLFPLLFITGPRAAGRVGVFTEVLEGGLPLVPVPLLVTDTDFYSQLQGRQKDRFKLVTAEELSLDRTAGNLLYEGGRENSVPVYLRRSDVLQFAKTVDGKKATAVLTGPPQLLDALAKESALRLLPVWVSLQTKQQFLDRAMVMVKKNWQLQASNERSSADVSDLAKRSADEVSNLVDEAARDVSYYMQKSPMFLYTLLNTGSDSEAVQELEQLLSTVL